MKILVTGASGFIGGHLVRELSEAGHTVKGWDINLSRTHDLRAPRGMREFDRELWHTHTRPDVVVHLAAKVGRLFGEDNLMETIVDNAGMTANVAKACGDHHVRLVYASTSEVYGDQGDHLCREDDDTRAFPHNLYGLSKAWGEDVCESYARDRLTIWRISMPYGPGLPAGRGRAAMINFLYNALHGLPITVHRDSERSWCWIGDTVRGMRMTIEQTRGGIWNVGRDDNATSMRKVAEMACDLARAPHSLIQMVDAPARQTVVKRLSTEKLRGLGWEPVVDLEEGMVRTLAAVRELPAPVAKAA